MNTPNQNSQSQKPNTSDQRKDTRKHEYKDHDKVLTNDENYDEDTQKFKGTPPDFNDKLDNQEKKHN